MQLETVSPLQSVPSDDPSTRAISNASDRSRTSDAVVQPTTETEGETSTSTDAQTSSRTENRADEERAERNPDENPLVQSLVQRSRFKLSFRVDDATNKVVISVIDPDTDELIRQVPPEEILELAERLESVKGSFFSSTV